MRSRPYTPRPPCGASSRSTSAETARTEASGVRRSTTSLKAPSRSSARPSASRPIHTTPKRRGSGRMSPGATANTNSGLLAMPLMRSTRRLPRSSMSSGSPGRRPCTSAKASFTSTSSLRCASGHAPDRSTRSLTVGRRPAGSDTSRALTGSTTSGRLMRPIPVTRASTAARPGSAASSRPTRSGARTSALARSAMCELA